MQDGSILEVVIRERQLDTFGHVNHAEIFRILEDARWERATKNGAGLEVVVATGKGPIMVDASVKFRRELKLRETVRVETSVEPMRPPFFKFKQKIRNQQGDEAVLAEFTFVIFDTVSRKMVPLDETWTTALGLSK